MTRQSAAQSGKELQRATIRSAKRHKIQGFGEMTPKAFFFYLMVGIKKPPEGGFFDLAVFSLTVFFQQHLVHICGLKGPAQIGWSQGG